MKAVKKWVVQDQSLLVQEPKLKPTPDLCPRFHYNVLLATWTRSLKQKEAVVIAIHTLVSLPALRPLSSSNLKTQNKWTKPLSWSGFGVPYGAGLRSLWTPVPTVEGRHVGLAPVTINRPRTHNGLLTFHGTRKDERFQQSHSHQRMCELNYPEMTRHNEKLPLLSSLSKRDPQEENGPRVAWLAFSMLHLWKLKKALK